MGRAGAGSGGGHSFSSGGHSISRSSGGHRVGSSRPSVSHSSHRAGSTSRSSFSSIGRSSKPSIDTGRHNPPPLRNTVVNTTVINTGNDYSRRSYSEPTRPMGSYVPEDKRSYGGYGGGMSTGMPPDDSDRTFNKMIFNVLGVCILIILFMTVFVYVGSEPKSSYAREKLDLGIAYNNDCVIDEINWVENIPELETNLKYFYEKTGVQPFVYLKGYDSSLTSDADKTAYAEQWYADNINNEGTFLFMYFAEADTDNDVGYMAYVNGIQVSKMMDAEALEIFWNILDNEWYSDSTTVDMFTSIFTETADIITKESVSGGTLVLYMIIAIIIIASVGGVVVIINKKREADAEKARETERILNTPLEKL